MRRKSGILCGGLWCGLVALLLVLVGATSQALANEDRGITPLFDDGKLTIVGAGFNPGEQVTIVVNAGDSSTKITAIANGQGSFRLITGIEVIPGKSVELEARGDQGSEMTAVTSAPLLLPRSGPSSFDRLPRTGDPVLPILTTIGIGLVALTGGLVLRGIDGLVIPDRRSDYHCRQAAAGSVAWQTERGVRRCCDL